LLHCALGAHSPALVQIARVLRARDGCLVQVEAGDGEGVVMLGLRALLLWSDVE
jgi:hypothetical protein